MWLDGADSGVWGDAGPISITGMAGAGNASTAIKLASAATLNATGSADVGLWGDSLSFDATTAIDVGTGVVTLVPKSPGTLISLGGSDAVGTPSTLGLTDAELDRITAGSVWIGDADSGSITVLAEIQPLATDDLVLTTGGAISDSVTGAGAATHSLSAA